MARLTLLTLMAVLGGCAHGLMGIPPLHPDAPQLSRDDFNRLADQSGIPLHWAHDRGALPGRLEPDELVAQPPLESLLSYVVEGRLSSRFQSVMAKLVDARRREAVRDELNQGRATIVVTTLDGLREDEIAFLGHMRRAARAISTLYEAQRGASGLREGLYEDDPVSQALFARNQGPWCEAPRTRRDPFCHALPTWTAQRGGVYPDDVTADTSWCNGLERAENAHLRGPFTAIIRQSGTLAAVPYTDAFSRPMRDVASALSDAADALDKEEEAALVAYLRAASRAFITNDWWAADEAWIAMTPSTNRWYVRVAPDDRTWDPCALKAGFHLTLGRVDPPTTTWSQVLHGLRDEMEGAVATVVGPPYVSQPVRFTLPEYVKLVLVDGRSRLPLGAVVGHTLPRAGPVADRHHQRSVAMIHVGTDPESLSAEMAKARELFDDTSEAHLTLDPNVSRLSRVLHEAARQLGPRPSWDGIPRRYATLEKLWSHVTASLLLHLLAERGLLNQDQVHEGWTHNVLRCFDEVTRHLMTDGDITHTEGAAAAMFLGWLREHDTLRFVAPTEDGRAGDFGLDLTEMANAIEALVQRLGQAFVLSEQSAISSLMQRLLSDDALSALHLDLVTTRARDYPEPSYEHVIDTR